MSTKKRIEQLFLWMDDKMDDVLTARLEKVEADKKERKKRQEERKIYFKNNPK